MKFTFLRPKRVGYYEIVDGKEQLFIAKWEKWDFFFVENKKEHSRLQELKEAGYKVLSFEQVDEKKKWEEVQEPKEVEKWEETIEELGELYMKKFDKDKVPPNKKNDEEWLRDKVFS